MNNHKKFIYNLMSKQESLAKNDYDSKRIMETNPKILNKELSKCVLFIKFVSRKYFTNFQYRGELHFGNIKGFRCRGFYDPIIGDINESTERIRFNHGKIILENNDKKISHQLTNKEFVDVKRYFNNNSAIFCVSRLDRSDFYKVPNKFNEFKIKPNVISTLFSNFMSKDKIPVIITNITMIYYLLVSALNKKEVFCALFQGSVRYYPFLDYDINGQPRALNNVINNFKGPLNDWTRSKLVAFTKSKNYSYQREFRFLLSTNSVLDNYGNVHIGNIVKYLKRVTKEDLLSLTIHISHPNDTIEIKELKQLWRKFPPYSNISYELMHNVKPTYIKTNKESK